MTIPQIALSLLAAVSLAACATAPMPELPPSDPASPAASEAPVRPVTSLGKDDATRTTDQLMAPPDAGTHPAPQ